MAETKKEAAERHMLPEGRLINHSLFERDAYQGENGGQPGKPKYKVELAFNPGDITGEGTIEDKLADALDAKWPGAGDAFLDGQPGFISPLKDGDALAAARAAKGKPGDAYKGKMIIRADTTFNRDGDEAAGGATVYGPNVEAISPVAGNTGEVYQGCYGIAAVTIHCYEQDMQVMENGRQRTTKMKGAKFYLVAFQKTRDGERLITPSDHSSLFKPVGGGGAAAGASAGRRRRPG